MLNVERAYSLTLSVAVAISLLFPRMIGISVLIMIGVVVLGIVKRQIRFKLSQLGLVFLALFSIYSFSLFFSNDLSEGLKFWEYKLSYFFFPLIFAFRFMGRIHFNWVAFSFLGSLVILFIVGVLHGVGFLQEMSVFESFTSSRFSFVHHPTYLSVYALFGVELIRSNLSLLHGQVVIRNGLIAILVIIQFMSMSLAGLIAFFIYLLIIFAMWIRRELGRKWMFLLGGIFIVLFTGITILVQPIKLQFQTAMDSFLLYTADPEDFIRSRQTYVTGNETRLIMWTASSYEVAEHPFGVGIGNVNLHLEERLKALKQSDAFIAHHYDPHNQFLMTWLEVGFFGLLCLFLVIWLSIRTGFQHGNTLFIILGASLFFQSLFESMLQRQSGVVFFTFWLCLLASNQIYNDEGRQKSLS